MSNFGGWGRSADLRVVSTYRVRPIAILALIAVGASACGHGLFSGSSSSSSGGGGGGSTTSRSVYVTNSADGKLSALNNSSGTLSSPATIAAGAANGPLGLVLTPPGSTAPVALYVANPADNTIHQFGVSSTGNNLSALATIAAGTQPQQVAVTPSGAFAYAINLGGSISEYLVNSSGQLSVNAPSSVVSGLTTPVSAVADSSSSFLYVTDPSAGAGLALTFTITSTGTLSFTSSVATGGSNPGQIAIDSISGGSTWVFVADTSSGVISVFQVVGSALSLVATIASNVANAPAAGMALATTSGGTFLYVANPSLDSVASFSFNTATGILASLAVNSGFNLPTGLAVANSSTTLFVTNNGNGTVSTLTIASTGALTAINSFNTENPANGSSAPEYIAVTP